MILSGRGRIRQVLPVNHYPRRQVLAFIRGPVSAGLRTTMRGAALNPLRALDKPCYTCYQAICSTLKLFSCACQEGYAFPVPLQLFLIVFSALGTRGSGTGVGGSSPHFFLTSPGYAYQLGLGPWSGRNSSRWPLLRQSAHFLN
jgi:hypothetical protein